MTEQILFVDDEPRILEAYRRTLRKSFNIVAASSGVEALELIEQQGPFPVVVSDMQMPEMSGVELLCTIKRKYPDIVRVMLTGNADQKTAKAAINVGDVHRFLTKPCPPDTMTDALNDALKQYQTSLLEKELLEKTVRGSITTLVEVLSIAKPNIFGRSEAIRNYALKCAKILKVNNEWEVETVALLSQLGLISLPDSLIEKVLRRSPITDEEQALFNCYTQTGAEIIEHIPRLESITDALRCLELAAKKGGEDSIPIAARIVKPAVDLVNAIATELSPAEALSFIQAGQSNYDERVMGALQAIVDDSLRGRVVEINVSQLEEGQEVAKDIKTFSGALLLEQGQRLNQSMIKRLVNFAHSAEIPEKLFVVVHDSGSDESNKIA